jgi:hypothetical protein
MKRILVSLVLLCFCASAFAVDSRVISRSDVGKRTKMVAGAGQKSSTYTLADAGYFVPQESFCKVDTYAAAAVDTLVSMNIFAGDTKYSKVYDGDIVYIRPVNSTHDIVISTAGNISIGNYTVVTLNTTSAIAGFIYDSTLGKWNLLSLCGGEAS